MGVLAEVTWVSHAMIWHGAYAVASGFCPRFRLGYTRKCGTELELTAVLSTLFWYGCCGVLSSSRYLPTNKRKNTTRATMARMVRATH